MEGELIFKVGNVNYKATFYYGYNSHYYATIYNNDNGTYMGQIDDIQQHEQNTMNRLTEFVKSF